MHVTLVDRAFATLLCVLGLYVVVAGVEYGLWVRGVPGPGFFPVLAGAMMFILSGVNLSRSFGLAGAATDLSGIVVSGRTMSAILGVVAALVAFIWLSPYLGMTLAGFLLIFAIGFLTQPEELRDRAFFVKLTAVSFGTIIVCNVLFRIALGVPVLVGPFGI
ncbi:tripartite tricarboxylate transporter TctB family protein [uncultured Cohaesibacter sp.]|uniref:tripartite tricarboxylate transporter TctB family protein n=1 Tax=uncultured Cohaesibacter sp. TaxID=1002546 RepID=UPI0029C6F7B7|nr:tripartite tricarboxylate transporter TctB family protein [uncultured Cohaesibacter sp.]